MTNWIQPVLSANGTIGDALAVSTSVTEGSGYRSNGYAYYAFDSNPSGTYLNRVNGDEDAWIQFVTADTIKITAITIQSGDNCLPSQGILQMSSDNGTTWQDVGSWNDTLGTGSTADVVFDNGYPVGNYFRLFSQGRSLKYPSKNADIANIAITADLVAFDFTLDFDICRQIDKTVDLYFDTKRKLDTYWRYDNYGSDNLLTITGTTLAVSQSVFKSAFYQTAQTKCFNIPDTDELWCKFDVYTTSYSTRWRAYNRILNSSFADGLCSYNDRTIGFWSSYSSSSYVYNTSAVLTKDTLQTVLLHMVSGASNGIIEAWIDGVKLYTYTGNVNNGNDFEDFFLQSDGADTFFSNVIISNSQISLSENAIADLSVDFDTLRRVAVKVSFDENFDTCRQVVKSVDIQAATSIKIIHSVELDFDTALNICHSVNFNCDTLRKIPHKLISTPAQNGAIYDTFISKGYQYLEINISAQQLVDNFKFATSHNFDIMQQVQGLILDYAFNMRVESLSQRGILSTCNCCSNIDELLYTQIAYTLRKETWNGGTYAKDSKNSDNIDVIDIVMIAPPKANASAHISTIAQKLGLIPVLLFDDFNSSIDINQEGVTYQDLISEIFGWTSRIPHKLINVFIRNNQLFVIQRGHEQNIIDLSSAHLGKDFTIQKTLLRTSFGVTRSSESLERNTGGNKNKPTKGHWETILGNELPEEEQGEDYDEANPEPKKPARNLPTHVTTVNNDITTDIYYIYDDDGNLTKTTTTTTGGDVDTKVIVENFYDRIKGEKLLYKEVTKEYEYDGEDWELINTKVVNHTYTTVGQQHISSVSDDGSVGGSVTTTARHNDKPTPYDDKVNQDPFYLVDHDGHAYIGSGWGLYTYVNGRRVEIVGYEWTPDSDTTTSDTTITGTLEEVLLYDSSFPVTGAAKLKEITNDIKWLNRKIQETITLDLYDFYHICDFNDRFILNGNVYYLQSNTISRTINISYKQSLTLIRWY